MTGISGHVFQTVGQEAEGPLSFPLKKTNQEGIHRAILLFYDDLCTRAKRLLRVPCDYTDPQELVHDLWARMSRSSSLIRRFASNGYLKLRDLLPRLAVLRQLHMDIRRCTKAKFPRLRFGVRRNPLSLEVRDNAANQLCDANWLRSLPTQPADAMHALLEQLTTWPAEPRWLHVALNRTDVAEELAHLGYTPESIAAAIALDLLGQHGEMPQHEEWLTTDHFLGHSHLVMRSLRNAKLRIHQLPLIDDAA